MSAVKRLTPPQSRKVNALVKRECCNCVDGKCLLLDDGDECVCPQLISYSLLCKWFRVAVLPADKLLYAELMNTEDKRRCTRPLRPAQTASNTARSAASGSPADKPPSVCEKCVPCYAIGAQKALYSAALTAAFP